MVGETVGAEVGGGMVDVVEVVSGVGASVGNDDVGD